MTVVRNKKEMPITVTIEPGSTGSGVRAMYLGPMNFEFEMPKVMLEMPGVRIIRFDGRFNVGQPL